jgi:hypothetical protein
VRIIQPSGPGATTDIPQQPGYLPARRIVGWTESIDLPHPSEHEELGLAYVYGRAEGTRLECAELGLSFDNINDDELAENLAMAQSGDKLGGWPYWVQNVEYPSCPTCGERMRLVFQIDSEDNVPFMFGDTGCGHITQCPAHKDVVAFGWACC